MTAQSSRKKRIRRKTVKTQKKKKRVSVKALLRRQGGTLNGNPMHKKRTRIVLHGQRSCEREDQAKDLASGASKGRYPSLKRKKGEKKGKDPRLFYPGAGKNGRFCRVVVTINIFS